MPIYEYKCNRCGHIREVWQRFSDPPLETCEVCGGPVKKIISNNTFHLKGTGWYVTDYASGRTGPAKNEKHTTPKKDEGQNNTKKDSGTEGSA